FSAGAIGPQLVCAPPPVPCTRITGWGCSALGTQSQSLTPGRSPPGYASSGPLPEKKVGGTGSSSAAAAVPPIVMVNAVAAAAHTAANPRRLFLAIPHLAYMLWAR